MLPGSSYTSQPSKRDTIYMRTEKKQARVPATMAEKFKWLKEVLRDRALSASAKNVATALVTFHNDRTGQCNPSQGRLAEAIGLSRRRVNRLVAELKAGGWIEVEGTLGASDYRLALDRAAEEAEPGECAQPDTPPTSDPTYPCARSDVGGVSDPTYPYVRSDVQNHTENHREERSKKTTRPAPAEAVSAPEEVQPATVPPVPANDDREVGSMEMMGLQIPLARYREWEIAFPDLDLRSAILSRAKWAAGITEKRPGHRLQALQTELAKLHTANRQARLDRKEAKVADAEAGIERCPYTGRNVTAMRAGVKSRFQW